MIKNAVRAPGERAKVAVASRERDVDPVGACVGMKGSRVQSIIREMRGEKIDAMHLLTEPVHRSLFNRLYFLAEPIPGLTLVHDGRDARVWKVD